jgi:hypothetical protein
MITNCFLLLRGGKRDDPVSNFAGRYTARGSPQACVKNDCINIMTINNMLALGALIDIKNDHIMISSKKSKTFLWRKENHLPVIYARPAGSVHGNPQGFSTHYSTDSVKMKIQNTIFGMNEELKVLACLTCCVVTSQ